MQGRRPPRGTATSEQQTRVAGRPRPVVFDHQGRIEPRAFGGGDDEFDLLLVLLQPGRGKGHIGLRPRAVHDPLYLVVRCACITSDAGLSPPAYFMYAWRYGPSFGSGAMPSILKNRWRTDSGISFTPMDVSKPAAWSNGTTALFSGVTPWRRLVDRRQVVHGAVAAEGPGDERGLARDDDPARRLVRRRFCSRPLALLRLAGRQAAGDRQGENHRNERPTEQACFAPHGVSPAGRDVCESRKVLESRRVGQATAQSHQRFALVSGGTALSLVPPYGPTTYRLSSIFPSAQPGQSSAIANKATSLSRGVAASLVEGVDAPLPTAHRRGGRRPGEQPGTGRRHDRHRGHGVEVTAWPLIVAVIVSLPAAAAAVNVAV